jgi:hypothetical protein
MSYALSTLASLFLKAVVLLLVANEARGLVLAGPVLYGMYEAGGTMMAMWIGFCSLSGIVLSVVVPMFLARKLRLFKPASDRLAVSSVP